ncbi:MAG: T9SS type A sorting domain-containing protein [Flavobacteriales bacterium]|nr:T9SS type A sorting domain-containing protein [Flavobacteriales bacterium]
MRLLVTFFVFLSFSIGANAQCIDTLNFPNLQPPCYPDFVPVCGCDGVTYRNACYADFATVLQYTDRPCEQVALDIYPNPCTYWLYATVVTKYESDVNLYIFDKNGTVFYYQFLPLVSQETLSLPIYGFDKGLYIIMVESNGVTKFSKFIKWDL